MKKFLTLAFATLMLSTAACANTIVSVNGIDVENSDAVIAEDNDSTYVPVRAVFEAMDCNVEWFAEEKTAVITSEDGNKVSFSAYSPDVRIIDEHMYVPLRKAVETLGFEIEWDEVNKKVNIIGKDKTETPTKTTVYTVGENSNFAEKINSLMPLDSNYVFSPLSFKYALAMAANGADEATKAEITKALDIEDIDKFNDDVKAYIDEHSSNTDTIKDAEDDEWFVFDDFSSTNLNIANSIWLNSDYIEGGDFTDEYKSKIADKYNGEAGTVDNNSAVPTINKWCSEKTNGKIPSIIESSDFLACLINAVYFNAKWQSVFEECDTHEDDFTDRDGNSAQIDFMTQTDRFKYYEDENIQMISLPYLNSDISMYIALTGDKRLDFESYINDMESQKVHITMPKFKTEYSVVANPLLSELGIKDAFDKDSSTPHFAPMFNDAVNNQTNVYIDKVIQKAYISVDEEGTEAAAVTAVMMDNAMAIAEPEKIFEFKADKPFTYFIRDNKTKEILFMGEYAYVK